MTRKLKLTQKPPECVGCPWYSDGTGFAADELHEGASITFMGARPDEAAEVSGVPFTGRTGKMIEANIGKYGLRRSDANWCNVTRCRYLHTNDKPASYYDAALFCGNAYKRPDFSTSKVVVPLDDEALMMVAGLNDVEVWRGSPIVPDSGLGSGQFVLPTVHPSAIFSKPRLRSASKGDFGRIYTASRFGAKAFEYNDSFLLGQDPNTFLDNFSALASSPESTIVLDVETNRAKPIDAKLRIFGIGWAQNKAANVAWEVLNEDQCRRLRNIVSTAKCRFVTATPFDYTVLTKCGFRFNWENCHDLTLLHSRFDIELPHTVAFIASTWTYRKFWKWLSDSEPYYYNCLDCAAEWEAFIKIEAHCKARDQEVLTCYEDDRAQIRTAVHVHLAGMLQDPETFKVEKKLYEVLRDDLETHLVAAFEKPKGEAPPSCPTHRRFSGKGPLKLRKNETSICENCARIRTYCIATKPLKLRSHKQMMALLTSEGKKIPYSRKHKRVSFDKAAVKNIATTYQDSRLFRLLDFRQRDKVANTYFSEAKVSSTGRVHANYHMHGAMHRWHSTDPNQQQVLKPQRIVTEKTPPEEGTRLTALVAASGLSVNLSEPHGPRRAFIAGPGRTFLAFDADGLHYRIAGVLSGDSFISDTLERYDREQKPELKPHIVNCCALFKVSTDEAIQWMHEEAPQYTFSKNFIYMLLNGGDTMALLQAAVNAKLDLDFKETDYLKNNWLERAWKFRDWRSGLVRQAEATGAITLYRGRRRRYYGLRWKNGKWNAGPEEIKAIYNHPLLGTEASYINPRLSKVMDYVEEHPEWLLPLLSHDGFMLEGPESETPHATSVLYPEMCKAWTLGLGKSLVVPWTAKTGNCWATLTEL